MKYFLLAGESSGDMYGAALMRAVQKHDSDADFAFWGGTQMRSVSNNMKQSIANTSFMGLIEVLKNYGNIRNNFKKAKTDILSFNPDIVIFIDYPGFNLRMAKWCKRRGFKVAYYVSPQIWAWRKYRYKSIKKYTDLFFIILPFEKELYKNLGVRAHYFGHPILEQINHSLIRRNITNTISNIALLPGSRIQEISRHLPILIEFARNHPDKTFLLSRVDHIPESHYTSHLRKDDRNIEIVNDLKLITSRADFAISCSGTVTLQLALYGIPQIVIYKASAISFAIAKSLVKLKYISLVNLILDKAAIPELIQDAINPKSLIDCYNNTSKSDHLKRMHEDYNQLRELLDSGNCSDEIAICITKYLKEAI